MAAAPMATTIGRTDFAKEGEALPSWLPQPKLRNSDVPPQDWALSMEQFLSFVDACRDTQCWQSAKYDKGHVNLYDITESLVKPWTRRTGASIALRMNPELPRRAELMVSHTWAEDMDECAEALRDYCRRASLEPSVAIWFCVFSQRTRWRRKRILSHVNKLARYQPGDEPGDPGPTVSEQLRLDPFASVIKSVCSLGMVVVHTSVACVYSRLWCVYEISEALQSQTPVHIAYSKIYLQGNSEFSLSEMLRAHTAEAQCSNPQDEDMIRESVCKSCGFVDLDRKIFEFRLLAAQEMFQELGGDWIERMATQLHRAELELKHGGKQRTSHRLLMVLVVSLLFATGLIVSLLLLTQGRVGSDPQEDDSHPQYDDGSDSGETSTTPLLFNPSLVPTPVTPAPTRSPAAEQGLPPVHVPVLLAIPVLLSGLTLLWCCWRWRTARMRQRPEEEELDRRMAVVRALAAHPVEIEER